MSADCKRYHMSFTDQWLSTYAATDLTLSSITSIMWYVVCAKKRQTTQAFAQDIATIIVGVIFLAQEQNGQNQPHKYTNTSFSAASTTVYQQLATTGKSGSFNRPCRWQMIIFISVTSVLATHLRGIDCSEFYGCSSWPMFRKAPEQEKVFFATVHAVH